MGYSIGNEGGKMASINFNGITQPVESDYLSARKAVLQYWGKHNRIHYFDSDSLDGMYHIFSKEEDQDFFERNLVSARNLYESYMYLSPEDLAEYLRPFFNYTITLDESWYTIIKPSGFVELLKHCDTRFFMTNSEYKTYSTIINENPSAYVTIYTARKQYAIPASCSPFWEKPYWIEEKEFLMDSSLRDVYRAKINKKYILAYIDRDIDTAWGNLLIDYKHLKDIELFQENKRAILI